MTERAARRIARVPAAAKISAGRVTAGMVALMSFPSLMPWHRCSVTRSAWSRLRLRSWLCVMVAIASCTRGAPAPARKSSEPSAVLAKAAAERIVAVGDLHGDLQVARRVLRLAGALDASDHWAGGKLTVVQTGDTLDRGDEDRAVIDLLERLRSEAAQAGGKLIVLSGNHEIMNVAGDLRYVSPTSAAAFEQGRAAAFAPAGTYARVLADWPVIAQVGRTVFVHGGVLHEHVRYGIDAINRETSAWMRGEAPAPAVIMREDAPVWTRLYSAEPDAAACAQLRQVLAALGADRMVVGHTPQSHGISAACGSQVWRIDTGLSHFYGGPLQLLEIESGQARVRGDAS